MLSTALAGLGSAADCSRRVNSYTVTAGPWAVAGSARAENRAGREAADAVKPLKNLGNWLEDAGRRLEIGHRYKSQMGGVQVTSGTDIVLVPPTTNAATYTKEAVCRWGGVGSLSLAAPSYHRH